MNHIWFFYVLVYVLTFKYSILTFAYWLVHRSSHNLIKFPRIPDMRGQASIFLFGLKEMACLTLCKKRPSLTHVEKKGRRSYTATKKGRHSHEERKRLEENTWFSEKAFRVPFHGVGRLKSLWMSNTHPLVLPFANNNSLRVSSKTSLSSCNKTMHQLARVSIL